MDDIVSRIEFGCISLKIAIVTYQLSIYVSVIAAISD